MANVFLNDLKLQKVWDAIRKNFYPVPPESGTAQPPTPAMEGDITIAFGRYASGQYQGYLNSIVSTIGDGKVTTSKLADSAVTKAKLASGAIDPVVTWGNGTTAGPTITIQAGKDTSVPKAVPAATAIYSGVVTTGTQEFAGDKTFKGNILSEQNIEALYGVSAHGHADLSIAAGGGAGTVTCISVNDAVKEPDGTGMITLDDYPTLTAYNADKTQINSAISQINSKIPLAATASNQLADKDFVNSSINTATATFRGTYTAASDTEAAAQTALASITTKDLNDYAFVKVENTPQTGVDKYKRYKYNGSNWVYEYTLNNSSFTASQWDAINSTITSDKVAAFNAKYDKPSGGIPKSHLESAVQTSLGKADSALQRSNFVSIGDHDTPVYFDASGYGQVIDALSIPGNIESTGGGVAAHGHADLGVSAGGGSGTTTAVRIGNGSPIEAVDGVVTLPTAQISQQPDGTIALGGVAIAVKGLGSFAYRSSINLAEVVGATDVVSSLSNAIGQTHAMAEDNSENIAAHDERILDLESYFDGASAKYALDSDKVDGHHYSELVTAIGISGKTLTWAKGGAAQDAITIPYAKESTTLETESLEGQEFIFRNSPKTIGADSLKLDRILGRTLVWNQLAQNTTFTNTITDTKTSIQFWAMFGGTSPDVVFSRDVTSPQVVQSIVTGASGCTSLTIKHNGPVADLSFASCTAIPTHKYLFTANIKSTNPSVAGGVVVDDINIIDLTLMFGAGYEPATVADFEVLFIKKNYSYNAGQLINNSAEGLETVGFNLFDNNTFVTGYYRQPDGTENPHSNRRCSYEYFPCLPNTAYYIGYTGTIDVPYGGVICWYDSNKNFISGAYRGQTANYIHTSPSNAAYFRMSSASLEGDVTVNLSDASKNGQYEPYKRSVLDLHLDNIQVKSPNIWDEEWVSKKAINNNGEVVDTNGYLISKNAIEVEPNTTYYFKSAAALYAYEYDKNGTKIGWLNATNNNNCQNLALTTKSNTAYLKFMMYGETPTANDICINISDSGFNGKYFPHGVLTFNGLKQAGDVRDEIVGGKYIRRVGSVDLGTLNFGYTQSAANLPYFITTPDNRKDQGAIICAKYAYVRGAYYSDTGLVDKAMYNYLTAGSAGRIMFTDSAYSTAAAFKTAMSGIMLNYELATYETYELVAPIPTAMPAGTTERRLPEDTSDSVLAPFACDMTYGTNPGDILASGIAWERIWGRPTIAHDKSNVSLTTLDRHVIKIGDKELYLIFSVGSDGTSYTLRVATGLNNGVYENEQVFNFATIDDTTINNICHL